MGAINNSAISNYRLNLLTNNSKISIHIYMKIGGIAMSLPEDAPQRDCAYVELRRRLILQQIPGGSRLSEPVWSQRLGVNRMALREAFARLESEGLIVRGDRSGYLVPDLAEQDIREVLEVRCCLECGAIERLVRREPKPSLEPLRQAVQQLGQLVEAGYLLSVTEADRAFHEQLVELSGNQRLAKVYAQAPLPMIHDQLIGTRHWPAECQRTLEDHRFILQAIEVGDAAAATARLRQHLDQQYLDPVRKADAS